MTEIIYNRFGCKT